uniref:Uncharacterized protein n=1 Tax=Lepeophtheirus salmonis TaxID=72036 RepID=A0A0K2TT80_LEPSM
MRNRIVLHFLYLCNLNGKIDNALLAKTVGCTIKFVQKFRTRVKQDGEHQ